MHAPWITTAYVRLYGITDISAGMCRASVEISLERTFQVSERDHFTDARLGYLDSIFAHAV